MQGLPISPGRHFDDVFRVSFATMMERGRNHGQQVLEDRVGSSFVAVLDNLHCLALPVAVPSAAKRPAPPVTRPAFVAEDPAVRAALQHVASGAARGLPILIRGETGTGKEQFARYAHKASRRHGAFVPVNCAALSESLIEAELFGHTEGAFTGARRGGARGLVCEADGGTLFLDEIGDMPLALQAVLLRLLDDWMVRPVGGGRSRQVNVLLVAATNAALDEAVSAGRFRSDLFYRLEAVSVLLPPLRDRSDFGAIVRQLLAEMAPDATVTGLAIEALAQRMWPGNVRELRNVLTRLTLAAPDCVIDHTAVDSLAEPDGRAKRSASDAPIIALSLREAARQNIAATYRESGGNLSATARKLGVSRNTIYRAIGTTE